MLSAFYCKRCAFQSTDFVLVPRKVFEKSNSLIHLIQHEVTTVESNYKREKLKHLKIQDPLADKIKYMFASNFGIQPYPAETVYYMLTKAKHVNISLYASLSRFHGQNSNKAGLTLSVFLYLLDLS